MIFVILCFLGFGAVCSAVVHCIWHCFSASDDCASGENPAVDIVSNDLPVGAEVSSMMDDDEERQLDPAFAHELDNVWHGTAMDFGRRRNPLYAHEIGNFWHGTEMDMTNDPMTEALLKGSDDNGSIFNDKLDSENSLCSIDIDSGWHDVSVEPMSFDNFNSGICDSGSFGMNTSCGPGFGL